MTGRPRWVGAVLVVALLLAGTGVPTWLRAAGHGAGGATSPVAVGGSTAAPEVLAAALAVLAAGAALALVGPVGRWVVVAVLGGCAVLVGVAVVRVLADPAAAARAPVAAATGADALVGDVHVTVWPWSALVAAALLVGVAVMLARLPWAAPGTRHERPVPAGDDVRADWDALSAGLDPSASDGPDEPPSSRLG